MTTNSICDVFICGKGAWSAAEAADPLLPWQRSQRAQRSGHALSDQVVDQTVTAWQSNRPKSQRMCPCPINSVCFIVYARIRNEYRGLCRTSYCKGKVKVNV